MNLEPLGTLRTCFDGKFAIPRQPGLCPDAWGRLEFSPAFRSREAVRGLEGFSHVWLVFGFHQTAPQGWHPTVRPPRLGGNRRVGVFASRSPFRPNPLGLSLVRLESIDLDSPFSPILHFSGVDLLDGTPIYDIKPYLPFAESIPSATVGYAFAEIPRLAVEIAPNARTTYESLPERDRRIIIQALSLDPRPAVCPADEKRVFGASLCGRNLRFSITDGTCTLLEITSGDLQSPSQP